jgi:hypothetical protein
MSTVTHSWRTVSDHFEPEDKDPKAQRALRGRLEQIDYAAYAANGKVIAAALAGVDGKKFENIALATAQARARWVATGVAVTEGGRAPSQEQVAELARLRTVYDELTQVYEAMRRMVERGYLEY